MCLNKEIFLYSRDFLDRGLMLPFLMWSPGLGPLLEANYYYYVHPILNRYTGSMGRCLNLFYMPVHENLFML